LVRQIWKIAVRCYRKRIKDIFAEDKATAKKIFPPKPHKKTD
jgi:hypothetical protein